MATDQQFCLRWNNHQSTLISVFDSLLENGTLVDCTLAAEGQYLKAHKVVLSACSPYLETLLSQHYEKHPIVILKDVKFTELKSMMDYMYRGEVNISQDQLGTFLKAAESLQIKGLTDNGDDAAGGSTTTKRQDVPSRPSVTEVRNTESKRPAPPADFSDASREGSISPSSLRKRRRTRRTSQGDDPDSHLDTTSNVCDYPINPSQTTPLSVPSSNVVPTPVQNLPKQIVKQEPISRIENNLNSTIAPESGLLKEKIEPPSEPLLEPKTEYLDYMNNENSIEVEDLTLDDDEDLDSSMDASRPGPSHGDMSNQGYQWPMSGDQSGTDEIFMAAQQAVGAASAQQRDSQERPTFMFASCGSFAAEIPPYLFNDNQSEYNVDIFSSSINHFQHINLYDHNIDQNNKISSEYNGADLVVSEVHSDFILPENKKFIGKVGRPRQKLFYEPPYSLCEPNVTNTFNYTKQELTNVNSVLDLSQNFKMKRKVGRPRKKINSNRTYKVSSNLASPHSYKMKRKIGRSRTKSFSEPTYSHLKNQLHRLEQAPNVSDFENDNSEFLREVERDLNNTDQVVNEVNSNMSLLESNKMKPKVGRPRIKMESHPTYKIKSNLALPHSYKTKSKRGRPRKKLSSDPTNSHFKNQLPSLEQGPNVSDFKNNKIELSKEVNRELNDTNQEVNEVNSNLSLPESNKMNRKVQRPRIKMESYPTYKIESNLALPHSYKIKSKRGRPRKKIRGRPRKKISSDPTISHFKNQLPSLEQGPNASDFKNDKIELSKEVKRELNDTTQEVNEVNSNLSLPESNKMKRKLGRPRKKMESYPTYKIKSNLTLPHSYKIKSNRGHPRKKLSSDPTNSHFKNQLPSLEQGPNVSNFKNDKIELSKEVKRELNDLTQEVNEVNSNLSLPESNKMKRKVGRPRKKLCSDSTFSHCDNQQNDSVKEINLSTITQNMNK